MIEAGPQLIPAAELDPAMEDLLEHGQAMPALEQVAIDEDAVAWALRRRSEALSVLADIDSRAAAEMARVREWEARKSETQLRVVRFAEALIAEALHRAGVKSIDTPNGRATLREQPVQFDYDEGALLDFVREAGLPYIETKERLQWGDLKKALKALEDGAVVYTPTGERIDLIKAQKPAPKLQISE
jgi:hypothetical protein